MKVLITFNLVIGILFAGIMVASAKWEALFLLGVFPFLSFGVLALLNVASIFVLWKRHRLRAFIPLGTLAFSIVASFLVAGFGTDFVLRNTPSRPNSFFNNQIKAELTDTAERLIGNGFKEILTYQNRPTEIHMIAGLQNKDVAPEILATLHKCGFQRTYVDDRQGIVMFGYCHSRTWFDYIWAKNGLTETYSMPSTITDVDIEDWTELIHIAKQGNTATPQRRSGIVFEPTIVYSFLKDTLGTGMLQKFANYHSVKDFTDNDKNAVLVSLNKHRLVPNALVEHQGIIYGIHHWRNETRFGFCICGCTIGDDFWVVKLVKQLLSEGILTHAPDGRHLKIKADLTDRQRLQVEWLHVGIMNFAYGNLLEKKQYPFQKKLGDNWYFNFW